MALTVAVQVACPHCGFQWRMFPKLETTKTIVAHCPGENGGCDKRLVVEFSPRIDVAIFEVGDEPFIPQESA